MRRYHRRLGLLAAIGMMALASISLLSLPALGATRDIDAKSRKAVAEFVELGKLCKRHGRSYLNLAGQLAKLEEDLLAKRAGEALAELLAAEACLREAKKKDELLKLLYGDYESVLTQASGEGSNQGNPPPDPIKLLEEAFRNACIVPPEFIETVEIIGRADTIVQRKFDDLARGDQSSIPIELAELSRQSERVYISSGHTTEIVFTGNTAPVRACK